VRQKFGFAYIRHPKEIAYIRGVTVVNKKKRRKIAGPVWNCDQMYAMVDAACRSRFGGFPGGLHPWFPSWPF
jgi:hypothetical protein